MTGSEPENHPDSSGLFLKCQQSLAPLKVVNLDTILVVLLWPARASFLFHTKRDHLQTLKLIVHKPAKNMELGDELFLRQLTCASAELLIALEISLFYAHFLKDS